MKKVKRSDGTITIVNEKFLDSVLEEGGELLGDHIIDRTPPVVTEEDLAADLKRQKANEAKRYLAETDWYAVRKAETEKEIPADILAKRAQARLDASE